MANWIEQAPASRSFALFLCCALFGASATLALLLWVVFSGYAGSLELLLALANAPAVIIFALWLERVFILLFDRSRWASLQPITRLLLGRRIKVKP